MADVVTTLSRGVGPGTLSQRWCDRELCRRCATAAAIGQEGFSGSPTIPFGNARLRKALESRLLSARDFARTICTDGMEIVESDSIHRTCATVVNRQAFGKLRSQTYSKFSVCFSFRASV